MKTIKRKINGGLYLVVDPFPGPEIVLPTLHKAITGGIDVLQLWNNWNRQQDKEEVITGVCKIAHANQIPVIMNEEWEWLKTTPLDGVHFDVIPNDLNLIRKNIDRPFVCGITCGNDLSLLEWADENRLDYISFCSMFPSSSAGVCEIVKKETVQEARRRTSLPIYLAGGITLENIDELNDTGMNGVALISGIMRAGDPLTAAQAFKNKLKEISHEAIPD